MINIFDIHETIDLITAVEMMKSPATYLLDNFFKEKLPVSNTSWVALEYMKGKRKLAPYIVRGASGVNIGRETSDARFYSAPLIGGSRVISVKDLEMRQFGEQQPIYSKLTAQDRQAQMQARDLQELTARIYNRKNEMAASLLTTGKVVIKGYADDGAEVVEDTIDYNWQGKKQKTWSTATAKIYDDLREGVDEIAEETGELPTMLLCGKNIEKYLLNNKEIKEWLSLPGVNVWQMAQFAPKYISPQTRYIGSLSALNLEIYCYNETYVDDLGNVQSYIPANMAVLVKPDNFGKQLFGAVTLIDKANGAQTYSAEQVPFYTISESAQTMKLTVYSRFCPVPNNVDSWQTFVVS